MNNEFSASNAIGWLFGTLFLAIGVVNTFWGNDPFFGIFIVLLATLYFFPADEIFKKITGYSFHNFGILKIVLGIFILWAALGVGELFDKIDLMMQDFKG